MLLVDYYMLRSHMLHENEEFIFYLQVVYYKFYMNYSSTKWTEKLNIHKQIKKPTTIINQL